MTWDLVYIETSHDFIVLFILSIAIHFSTCPIKKLGVQMTLIRSKYLSEPVLMADHKTSFRFYPIDFKEKKKL